MSLKDEQGGGSVGLSCLTAVGVYLPFTSYYTTDSHHWVVLSATQPPKLSCALKNVKSKVPGQICQPSRQERAVKRDRGEKGEEASGCLCMSGNGFQTGNSVCLPLFTCTIRLRHAWSRTHEQPLEDKLWQLSFSGQGHSQRELTAGNSPAESGTYTGSGSSQIQLNILLSGHLLPKNSPLRSNHNYRKERFEVVVVAAGRR
ncbi:unnamed protein product [Pleuronectes platessa]|uniref:Uncharacterized protein n=1 Tax=Pleuronectes platessa TaxID=8262 RepID=A0A9N7VBL4_PLEPL|nr:unnamed protein product [Pleuronectes platessa]